MKNQTRLQELIKEVDHFLWEHNFDFLFESDWQVRWLCLLFPSLSKSLSKLIYDMEHLKKLLSKIEAEEFENP